MEHIMLDIETMGGSPDGALIQIGACVFSLSDGQVGLPWSVNVSLHDSVNRGMKIDASTVEFWMGQPGAWATLQENKHELSKALSMLRSEHQWRHYEGVWTNAPLFDFAILRHAYKICGQKPPWHYRQERCSRTLLYLAAQHGRVLLPERSGVHHNAGHDAQYQAVCAIKLHRLLAPPATHPGEAQREGRG